MGKAEPAKLSMEEESPEDVVHSGDAKEDAEQGKPSNSEIDTGDVNEEAQVKDEEASEDEEADGDGEEGEGDEEEGEDELEDEDDEGEGEEDEEEGEEDEEDGGEEKVPSKKKG